MKKMLKTFLRSAFHNYPIILGASWYIAVFLIGNIRPESPTTMYHNHYKGFLSTFYVSDIDLIIMKSAFAATALPAIAWFIWVFRESNRR